MSNMNLKDALDRALRTTKQYIDEETKLDNVLDLERTVSVFEKGEIVLDENNRFNFENGELFYNLYNIESEIKINLNNTISDKEYLLNISDPEECTYRKSDNGTESFSFRIYDYEISNSIGISLTYVEFEGVSQSTLTVRTIGLGEEVTITVNSFEIVTLEYKSKIQSKMIENVDYEKITNKPYPIISIENGTNKAIPFTDWIRFNKYNLIDRRTTDINNTPYENSTGKNNEVGHPSNEINPAGNGIKVYNTAASGMENAKGLKFNISQELVDNVNAGFITFSCTFNAVSRPTMVRLVSPNGLYSEDLIPFTKSHSGASATGTFDLSFNTAEDYSYTLLAGDYYILFAVDDPEGDTSSLIDLSNVVVHIEPLQSEDKIKVTRDIDKFIERDNKIPYEPTGDYNPATKKYVDDAINENGFSGDYNDLENRPCYQDSKPDFTMPIVPSSGYYKVFTGEYTFLGDYYNVNDFGEVISRDVEDYKHAIYTYKLDGKTCTLDLSTINFEDYRVSPNHNQFKITTILEKWNNAEVELLYITDMDLATTKENKNGETVGFTYSSGATVVSLSELIRPVSLTNIGTIKQLDEKFIPDTIVRKEHTHNYLPLSGGTIESAEFAPLKIKNIESDSLLLDTTTDDLGQSSNYFFQLPYTLDIKVGETYTLVSGDRTVTTVCKTGSDNDTVLEFWNAGSGIDVMVRANYNGSKGAYEKNTTYVVHMYNPVPDFKLYAPSTGDVSGPAISFENEDNPLGHLCIEERNGSFLRYNSDASSSYTIIDEENYSNIINCESIGAAPKEYVDTAIANAGPSVVMLSQTEYNDLGDNIDPNTLYIIG